MVLNCRQLMCFWLQMFICEFMYMYMCMCMCMCMYVDLCVAGEKEDDRLNKGIGKGMIFWMQQYNITIIFQNPKQLDVR